MKNNHTNDVFKTNDQVTSKSGYLFSIADDYWTLDKNTKIPVKILRKLLDAATEEACLKALATYASAYSSSHVLNIFFRFVHYLRTVKPKSITCTSLINYRAALSSDHEWYLATIRGFLRKWHTLGYEGIPDDVIELLDEWTLKGNVKGDVIKRLDPNKGPLSDIELQAYNEGVVQAFEKDYISLTEMALGLVISNTGRRQIQISHLRVRDVLRGKNVRGESTYLLNVPRAKQRASGFREQFKQFAITSELWVILSKQAEHAICLVEDSLGFKLQQHDRVELPLFPDMAAISLILFPSKLHSALETDQLHIKSAVITQNCRLIADVAEIYSERTGELLNLSSNRFRYTAGTRAAREGFGEMIIAELLDHSDNQNAGVYIENIPEHVAILDQAVGHQLAQYAQAFAGVLVNTEKDAVRGDELTSRIKNDGEDIGTCGSYGFCGANVPIPCYTCMHFQPWLYGPHEVIYEDLIAERDRLINITGDMQIASVNDRSIIAVADVIQRCTIRREELDCG